MNVFGWLVEHVWIEIAIQAAILLFLIFSVSLASHTARVIELKPLKLPASPEERPLVETDADRNLMNLGFHWIGDFDTSTSDKVVMLSRFYTSIDNLHHAVILNVHHEFDRFSLLEFCTSLAPRGSVSTNNNRQLGIFSYRLEKLVVRAPWKRSVKELLDLHASLCEVAVQNGFTPHRISISELPAHILADSRADMEGERARGCMRPLTSNTYRTTFKGALLYTPRIWLKMTHGLWFGWCQPTDRKLMNCAQRRFARAAREG